MLGVIKEKLAICLYVDLNNHFSTSGDWKICPTKKKGSCTITTAWGRWGSSTLGYMQHPKPPIFWRRPLFPMKTYKHLQIMCSLLLLLLNLLLLQSLQQPGDARTWLPSTINQPFCSCITGNLTTDLRSGATSTHCFVRSFVMRVRTRSNYHDHIIQWIWE